MVPSTVSSSCALRPERIQPRMRLEVGTSRPAASRSISARSSGAMRVATVTDLFGRVKAALGGIGWSAVASASAAICSTVFLGHS
jgi:hypothetical protein